MTTKRAPETRQPIEAFIAKKAQIDTLLDRIVEFSECHFDVMPDEINWGHVGNLSATLRDLQLISDALFCEGEHAR